MSFVKARCPHCDAMNDLDNERCVTCGKSMKAQPAVKASDRTPIPQATKKGASGFTVMLLVISTAVAGFGLLLLSNATAGVGVLAFGVWLGVMARISQAGDHYYGN